MVDKIESDKSDKIWYRGNSDKQEGIESYHRRGYLEQSLQGITLLQFADYRLENDEWVFYIRLQLTAEDSISTFFNFAPFLQDPKDLGILGYRRD
jgi:hypothetical protein